MSDQDRYARLNGPYGALYRAARKTARAEKENPSSGDAPESEETVHTDISVQVARLLADVEMSEEDRQRILANISCPCCGGSGASFSMSLKPGAAGKF